MAFDESQPQTPNSDLVSQLDESLEGGTARLRCKACGTVLADRTRFVRWQGTALPVFVNPSGMFFELVLVDDVKNVIAVGPSTSEATWFVGYAWQCVLCRRCIAHVGWRWQAESVDRSPPGFCGLIRDRIVLESADDSAQGA